MLGLTPSVHGQVRNSIGKENRVNSVVPLGVTVVMVHGLRETAAWASFRKRDLDLVTWWVLYINKINNLERLGGVGGLLERKNHVQKLPFIWEH